MRFDQKKIEENYPLCCPRLQLQPERLRYFQKGEKM